MSRKREQGRSRHRGRDGGTAGGSGQLPAVGMGSGPGVVFDPREQVTVVSDQLDAGAGAELVGKDVQCGPDE
ncbi:hypothetical protein GCM10027436_42660 [Actinophytocola sediminis]